MCTHEQLAKARRSHALRGARTAMAGKIFTSTSTLTCAGACSRGAHGAGLIPGLPACVQLLHVVLWRSCKRGRNVLLCTPCCAPHQHGDEAMSPTSRHHRPPFPLPRNGRHTHVWHAKLGGAMRCAPITGDVNEGQRMHAHLLGQRAKRQATAGTAGVACGGLHSSEGWA